MSDSDFSQKVKNQKRRRALSAIIIAVIVLLALIPLGMRLFPSGGSGTDADATVTISISCADLSDDIGKLNDEALREYVPEDGVILPLTEVNVKADEATVLDVLQEVCLAGDIQIETEKNPAYGTYVKGINYLYEFSAGKYSGWMFSVDGEDSSYSADKVRLTGGEDILWYYVVDYNAQE